jgi:hypothetical protein
MTPKQIENLATYGVALDISSNVSLQPDSLESLLIVIVEKKSHLTINAKHYKYDSLIRFSNIGWNYLTIKL